MSKQQATCSIRHVEYRLLQVACCFDMLLVWTGLNAVTTRLYRDTGGSLSWNHAQQHSYTAYVL